MNGFGEYIGCEESVFLNTVIFTQFWENNFISPEHIEYKEL